MLGISAVVIAFLSLTPKRISTRSVGRTKQDGYGDVRVSHKPLLEGELNDEAIDATNDDSIAGLQNVHVGSRDRANIRRYRPPFSAEVEREDLRAHRREIEAATVAMLTGTAEREYIRQLMAKERARTEQEVAIGYTDFDSDQSGSHTNTYHGQSTGRGARSSSGAGAGSNILDTS